MSRNRSKLTRRNTSRWLDHPREYVGDPLGAVLSAAAAASRETDAAAEERAVAQFRDSVGLAPAPVRAGRRLFTAPVIAAGAVGALLFGGVAFAATQGALDGVDLPFDGHDNRSDQAPDAPTATNPGHDGKPGKPGASGTPGAEGTDGPQGTPGPSLGGLCKAFQAGAFKDDKKSPAFQALAAAAGGVENVATYCVDRIGPSTKPAKPTQPTHPAKPTQAAQPTTPPKPTQAASPTPKPKPTQAAEPTKKPKPTKKPAGKP